MIMLKKIIAILLPVVFVTAGCSYVTTPVISDESKPESSILTDSTVSTASSVGSDLNLPSCEFCLTDEYTFEVNVMTTEDWQAFEDADAGAKTFSLTFPESWIRDAEDAPTFHNQYTDVKIFESVAAVKLPAGFDFAGSFSKENFEDSMSETQVVGDITVGKLLTADGEKTYAAVIQSVVPEGGGEIQIDRWYPYFYVIVDGDYAYCMQFYSLDNPNTDDSDSGLFHDIVSTFKIIP